MDNLKRLFEDKTFSALLLLIGAGLALTGDYAAQTVALGACFAIALMGVGLIIGYAGMITVGHAAVWGVGAYAAASLTWKLGAPMPLGMAAGAAMGALAGWALSLPALRAQDKYVALATLAAGLAFSTLFIEVGSITNGSTGITLGKREIFGRVLGALDFALLGLALAGACMVAINGIATRAIGRGFEAMRDSEVAADCMGVSPGRQKQIAFILSGFFCGLSGALFSYSQGYIAPNTFGFDASITFLLAIMLGGKKTRSGALIGAAVVIYLPVALNSVSAFQWISGVAAGAVCAAALSRFLKTRDAALAWPASMALAIFAASFLVASMVEWRQIIYGLMILGVAYYLPDGLAASLPKPAVKFESGAEGSPMRLRPAAPGARALDIRGVGMNFDGLAALEGVDLAVERGRVVGVIGPNGAGKSTLMNVITGVYKPTSGSVLIEGKDNAGMSSAEIAKSGVARTFQNTQIFTGLTVIENVLVGMHFEHETSIVKTALGLGRDKDARAARRANALLEFVGLGAQAGALASSLSYGEQRFLEIARALATNPTTLLLDEPAAGLRGDDLRRLKSIIAAIAKFGVAVVVIEHHMDLIAGSCDEVLAINFGIPMARGTPAEVLNHPEVKKAYLGS